MTEPALGRVPWAPRCLLKLEEFFCLSFYLFVCLILSLGVKCSETRDGGEVLPPVHLPPQARRCFRQLQAPISALQLFSSCPAPPQRQLGEAAGGGGSPPAQLLALAGSGEGCDMKEPWQARVAEEPPTHHSPPPGGLLAGSAHLGHRSHRPQSGVVVEKGCCLPALPGKGRRGGL